jgi:hypothetical protein
VGSAIEDGVEDDVDVDEDSPHRYFRSRWAR